MTQSSSKREGFFSHLKLSYERDVRRQKSHIKPQIRTMQFITQRHHIILENHDRFQQEATVYEENMCGKLTEFRGIDVKELQPKLEFFKSLGPIAS